ncbi:MAG: triose-phosphate isomerase [bacterium]
MKKSIVAGNWKMYLTSSADASILTTTLRNNLSKITADVIIAPPAIWLSEVASILGKNGKVKVAAQNMFYEAEGAYTGEISPLMVKEMAEYIIIGHSERREFFGENNMDVNEKVIAALKAGLTPIICVGEKKKSVNAAQPIKELKEALMHIPKKRFKDVVVAYEPVWAIGTGESADPIYATKVITQLRQYASMETPILYGGSVNAQSVKGFAERPEIDGVLVGGASVKAKEFVKICQIWDEMKSLI